MLEILARGIAPTARAWPILVLPKRINSSSRRSEHSCVKQEPDAARTGGGRRAWLFSHQEEIKGSDHAGNNSGQARHIPEDARNRLLCAAQPLRCRQRTGIAASGIQGDRLD